MSVNDGIAGFVAPWEGRKLSIIGIITNLSTE